MNSKILMLIPAMKKETRRKRARPGFEPGTSRTLEGRIIPLDQRAMILKFFSKMGMHVSVWLNSLCIFKQNEIQFSHLKI